MVAAVASQPPARLKAGVPIPIHLRLKAENLYLIKCLEPSLVAKQTGLTRDQVSSLANRNGWVKLRKAKINAAKARMAELAVVPMDEVTDAIARQCDEHSLKALERTGRALESKGKFAARDAQAFSGALRNLVQVGRTVRGLDKGGNDQPTNVNLNFFLSGPGAKPAPAEVVNVTASAVPALPA